MERILDSIETNTSTSEWLTYIFKKNVNRVCETNEQNVQNIYGGEVSSMPNSSKIEIYLESDQVKSVYSSLQTFININANLKDLINEDEQVGESLRGDNFSNGNQISGDNIPSFNTEDNFYYNNEAADVGSYNRYESNETPIKKLPEMNLEMDKKFSASKIVPNTALKNQIASHNNYQQNAVSDSNLTQPFSLDQQKPATFGDLPHRHEAESDRNIFNYKEASRHTDRSSQNENSQGHYTGDRSPGRRRANSGIGGNIVTDKVNLPESLRSPRSIRNHVMNDNLSHQESVNSQKRKGSNSGNVKSPSRKNIGKPVNPAINIQSSYKYENSEFNDVNPGHFTPNSLSIPPASRQNNHSNSQTNLAQSEKLTINQENYFNLNKNKNKNKKLLHFFQPKSKYFHYVDLERLNNKPEAKVSDFPCNKNRMLLEE